MTKATSAFDWKTIRGVIFDMDGTLYRQGPVRLQMAFKLLVHVFANRHGWRDLLVLRHYRNNREALAEAHALNVSHIQFKATAQAYRLTEEQVAKIVHVWMHLKPLPALGIARFKDIDRIFEVLRARGVKIGVFSDYPVEEKLKTLGLVADTQCCATASEVNRFKPEPAGLIKTVEMLGLACNDCVMIGDRVERDGLCAERASVAFLLCKGQNFYTRLLADLNRI